MYLNVHSVKQSNRQGLEGSRLELDGRQKVQEELQGVRVWLEAAASLLSELELSGNTQELQVSENVTGWMDFPQCTQQCCIVELRKVNLCVNFENVCPLHNSITAIS